LEGTVIEIAPVPIPPAARFRALSISRSGITSGQFGRAVPVAEVGDSRADPHRECARSRWKCVCVVDKKGAVAAGENRKQLKTRWKLFPV
jgi:hypothetical protein